ncbi:MAG TPA: DUF4397 domain-containing protein [Arachidicoccus sp.]
MKRIYISGIKRATLLSAVAVCFSLSSCLDHDHYYDNVEVAGIALINAAPASPSLDLIGDQQRELLPTSFSYDTAIAYLSAYPGYRVFGFAKKNDYNVLVSQQIFLQPGKAYSIFLADSLGAAKMFSFSDSLKLPDSTKANIRFVNMSPDSKGLDFVAGTNTMFNNVAFGKASEFATVAPTDNLSFQVKENGGATVVATLSNITIKKGEIYTIWARGFENSTVDSLKIGLKTMRNR